jgi:hypothetical protein
VDQATNVTGSANARLIANPAMEPTINKLKSTGRAIFHISKLSFKAPPQSALFRFIESSPGNPDQGIGEGSLLRAPSVDAALLDISLCEV